MTVARPAVAPTASTTGAPGAAEAGFEPSLPFEKALEMLEDIVRRLEKGDVPLDESVAIYERGEALKRHCEALLQKAEARIQKITLGADGKAAGTAPLDVE
ncbi:exodeoxyribonuclease VII small subunit [Methylobacterium sp. BTF04]|uniref:exodeoxyribonuclease VII small subunit n=1 Tax=Methylobacterium sp. BTF04 TaxID=2708300 RepID=UPI0013D6D2DA|nr:exodeoxyribonuclease VII small subunit [Methylobacterium sp. BTF04]NEU14915.1 exodeoxyribonuclease VII small subunit [Methylobacterium sp. BTF04]